MLKDISFDPIKSQSNELKRGLAFLLVLDLEWGNALIKEDLRKAYGERRFQVLGLIHGRLHAVVFTPRDDKVHVISLRKANKREVKHYEKTQPSNEDIKH
jgi:uncharacterized protein